uniref:Uncharacterized protein n=1 Tax=Anguilla anguilla TaxID=7936 RepID=A0A0E9UYR2_ANGAN
MSRMKQCSWVLLHHDNNFDFLSYPPIRTLLGSFGQKIQPTVIVSRLF